MLNTTGNDYNGFEVDMTVISINQHLGFIMQWVFGYNTILDSYTLFCHALIIYC